MQRHFKKPVHLLYRKVQALGFIIAFLFAFDSFAQVPAAPDKLGAVGVSSSTVILNWADKSTNETGFEIERSLSFGIGYSLIATTAPNVRTYTDAGRTAGTTYYYRVRAVNASGNSSYATDAGVQVARSDFRRFLLDFGDPAIQTTATSWNNITSVAAGTIIPLKDSNGNATAISLEVIQAPANNYAGSSNDWNSAGYNGQVADYPTSACNDSHFAWAGGGSYRLTGLDNSKVYDIRIFGSRAVANADRVGLYTINGQQKILNGANNSSETILFSNNSPINAAIVINFNVAQGSTFGYLNVLDIIESTNPSPPQGTVSKVVLTPGMVSAISPVGEGNPTLLVDEQTLAGNPAGGTGGQPTTSWGTNLGPKVMSAQIDLGAVYAIKQVWLFDSNGVATLPNGYQVIANTSAGDVTLVNSAMTGYLTWNYFNVDVVTRTLTIISPNGYVGMNELVLYGYSITASPVANAGADQLIGLAANSASLTGTGTDSDGTIASYAWSQVSGPNTAVLSGSTTATVTISSLNVGTYVFRLTVTDDQGGTGSDDVTVTVSNDGAVPDALELEALRRIAEGSDGDRLTSQGWPSVNNWPATATSSQFGSWPGVTVMDEDIVELSVTGDYYGYLPDVELPQLKKLIFVNTLLYGINASMPNLEELRIGYNVFVDIPDFINYPNLKFLDMNGFNNGGYCAGCYPYEPDRTDFNGRNWNGGPDLSSLLQLDFYEGGDNNFITFPTGLITLTNLKSIYLFNNYLQSVPNEIINYSQLTYLSLGQNYISNLPPTLVDLPDLQTIDVSQNRLDFGDLEQFFSGENEFKKPDLYLEYGNQGNLPPLNVTASAGKFTLINNRSGGVHTHYQWQQYNAGNWVDIPNKTLQNLVFDNMDQSYAGKRYRCEITNDWITDITIYSSEFTIESVSDFPLVAPGSLAAAPGSSLSISLSWIDNSTGETGFEIERSTTSGSAYVNVGIAQANAVSFSDPALLEGTMYYYRIRAITATGSSDYSEEASATPQYNIDELITQDSLLTNLIPPQVKITRDGRIPTSSPAPSYPLNELNQGDDKLVFPGCIEGSYFVGFELKYDLSDGNTTNEWLSKLQITLLEGNNIIWERPLQISSKNQNFLSVSFYSLPISCGGTFNYHFIINQKLNVGAVPEERISLNLYMYEDKEFNFNTAAAANFACPEGNNNLGFNAGTGESSVSWDYPGSDATEYDLEWVFLADHEIEAIENFGNSAIAAFQSKEGVRITTPERSYTHLIYYQTGKLWYRVRAVGYNPAFPDHRIVGQWAYYTCPQLSIDNPEPTKNWQVQTVFAEEGKYKKVVHYFDGTLRTRQSQTNLSTEGITMTGETLYDFEGRKSVEILAAPSVTTNNSTLTFKPGLNNFQAVDALVASNTSPPRTKFNYDNQLAENSKLSEADGAGLYYSPANTTSSVHKMLIPNGEGFVYSQTEYLNDGTGRIRRQSGVGEEFRMDGNHATRYYYGSASKAELVRLFGSNVGNASHYKKNLVVDGNEQVSVSYHDQSDRVIASALAGVKPTNVDPLESFSALPNGLIIVPINDKNQRKDGQSITTHKILNTSLNTPYIFTYDLTSNNPADLDCPTCAFDITLNITDPDGELVSLGSIAGNQAPDNFSYVRTGFSAAGCAPGSNTVQINIPLAKIGDYTITKTLKAVELTFDELKTVVQQKAYVQAKIQQLRDSYVPDATQCDICTTGDCADTDQSILDAMNKVASLDCENIRNGIIDKLRKNSNNPNYFPTDTEIGNDADFCRYLLCVQDKASDVFEKKLAIAANWTNAVQNGYHTSVDVDPFFNEQGLSGYGYKDKMVDRLNNIVIGDINTNLKVPRPLQEVLNPTNPLYYIDDLGNATNSTSNGYHILYYELMKENPSDYATQLDNQRWALYKSFYLEAKRKTKLSMPAYSTDCAKAKEELEKTDKIPTTEEGVNNWEEAAELEDISDDQINSVFYLLTLNCNSTAPLNISPQHITDIKNHLRIYFTSNTNNFFRHILKNDIALDANNQITNASLRAINTILAGYGGCESALIDAAVDDPLVCNTTKTINFPSPAQLPNLVVNPQVAPTPTCTPFITNNDCYNGWSAQSGAPQVIEPGVIRLTGQQCNIDSKAVGGSIALPDGLVPGKKYRFSVTYRAVTQNDKVYCEFFNNDGYRRADGTIFNLGQSMLPFTEACAEPSPPPSSNFLASNPCQDPGAAHPNNVQINGIPSTKVWQRESVPQGGWTTDEVIFTATEKSKNFVFTTISNAFPGSDLASNNLTTWGANGTFENSSDESIPQMFFGTNTNGSVNSSAAHFNPNGSLKGLSIYNIGGPQAKGGMLLRFNATTSNTAASKFYIEAWVRTQPGSSISSNENALLYITTPHPDWEILSQNRVPFCKTIHAFNWVKLNLTIARKPGVGAVPLPDFFSISTTMTNSEALINTGALQIDDISVFDGNNTVNNSPVQSVDIKDVIIKEYYDSTRTICVDYGTTTVPDYIAQYKAACLENEAERTELLAQLAIDKYLEEEITVYSNTLRANCLDGATENLQYSYNPQEYHYTLYYYDQAGNLVQTVPPEGVLPNPVSEPQHKLITRYQYNSLNQLLSQTTPDAGESNFWYNDKSQLKLSQNAQQLLDNKYSYTKYDEQGRITEVGEMAATGAVEDLIAQFDDLEFPREQNLQTPGAGTYVLTDVTRTHYDQPSETFVQEGFTQQQLRNRVSWVEVTDQASQTPLVLEATSVYKNEAVLNGVNPQGVLASEVTQSGQTYLRIQNNCSGGCLFAGVEFNGAMPVTAGETYLIKAKGYSQSTAPVGFDVKGNGTQNLASVSSGAALPIGAGAEGWITQTIIVPARITFLTINLAWDAPALNEVFFINEFEIIKQTIDYTNRATTYYSYDIHGNVKSLLQNVPGLNPKRTDYAYDLVSGKVNFVLYQYQAADQFIHQYKYDADNRITEVFTSTDGFLWDKEAEYSYYLHGPLARVELGEHRVQGLDYYYTLQGWLKGVNSPTGANAQTNDPGLDGVVASPNDIVGKDVFAYNLGYFNGDYKPIGTAANAALIETGSTGLWTSGAETLGLYNGNISWMATDLAKIGLENNSRNTGVQAMQYRYDQLHRLVRSQSMSYASGVATRTSAAYDEDYTYDANGNILTLQRNNELGALKDNFTYQYYAGTNRLSSVAPVTESVTYTGAVTSNSTLYRNITLKGNAYLPTGEDVTLRATENIFIEPEFNKAGGNSFRAYITDEGVYQYDAIGNLIADGKEGTKISWTPYGKVRQVKAKGDSVVIDYRYDAGGNRIEKRIRTLSSGEGWGEVITTYVRDASGNVMTIYSSPLGGGQEGALEQPIYGSSRLGQYKGGRKEGQRLLGRKQFELSNHLGNVLTVITDNINMSPTEGVSSTIVSATDYYPFGLEMRGRTFSDTTYRYGFNGKEKDQNGEFDGTLYDYGMRLYNPSIGRFFTPDPLRSEYPMLTPYQFAGNTPIWAIDLDGLEPLIASDYKTLDQLKKKLNLEYCYELSNDKKIYQVTVSQNFWGIHQSHTLTENGGPKQTDLSTFWGKASYAANHPGNAAVLNKVNNMSYRKENDQGMAFQDIANELRGHLKNKPNKESTIDNTFLHVAGQSLITTLFGKGYADLSGDIHERDHTALMTGDMSGQTMKYVIDNYADIINNEWGQRWGEAISKDLGITKDTEWTNDLTSKYLNALQDKITKGMGVKFDKTFEESDEFVKKTTEFINANK